MFSCRCWSRPLDGATAYSSSPPSTAAGLRLNLLEARHRVHARGEYPLRCGKPTGLGRSPSEFMEANTS